MPQPSIEKLQLILTADPRSRVFVELARLLLEQGDHARAMEVCRKGLEHHPDSIFARILWGRALLGTGQVDKAISQFDIAIAIDPANPYAYNLAGEALYASGLYRPALPILARAAQLQPGDERILGWLEEAKRQAANAPAPAAATAQWSPAATPPAPAAAPPASATAQWSPAAAPPAPAPPASVAAAPVPAAAPPGPAAAPPGSPPGTPPPLPAAGAQPPPIRRASNPRLAVFEILPDAPPPAPAPPPQAAPAPDAAEAERIAQKYEHELRQKMMEPEEPPGFFRRHALAVVVAALCVILGGGGGGTYWFVSRQNRSAEVRSLVNDARKGLARDTVGALQEAAKVLDDARDLDPNRPEAVSLSAQVEALLFADHSRADAKPLAEKLAERKEAGVGGLAARWLLAGSDAERGAAAEAILSAPSPGAPLVDEIAGRILLARGEKEKALARFELAAKASPPSLRALADLADFARSEGKLDDALQAYRTVLSAHPTHPRSVIGAAEIRCARRREIPEAVQSLRAVAADPDSAPAVADRLRFELAFAKCLAANNERGSAVERLEEAAKLFPQGKLELAAAAGEVYFTTGALDLAEREATRAVSLAPKDSAESLLLLSRIALAAGRYRELLKATQGSKVRQVQLARAVACYEMGDYARARAELEQTRRESKGKMTMTSEGVAYYLLVELGAGRMDEARKLGEKLGPAKDDPDRAEVVLHPMAFVALGRLELAAGNADAAERQFRAAVQRDADFAEGHCALGRFLLSRGKAKEAQKSLAEAARLDPAHAEAFRALGQARLALGDPSGATAEFQRALRIRSDPETLRGLSAAQLASKHPVDAQRTADQAIEADRRDPASYAAAVRAAQAQGDRRAAQAYARQGLRVAKRGSLPEEIRNVLEDAARGR